MICMELRFECIFVWHGRCGWSKRACNYNDFLRGILSFSFSFPFFGMIIAFVIMNLRCGHYTRGMKNKSEIYSFKLCL